MHVSRQLSHAVESMDGLKGYQCLYTYMCIIMYMHVVFLHVVHVCIHCGLSFLILFVVVDCDAPSPASMVIIEPYTDTIEGTIIAYHCDDGLIPSNTIVATCKSDGRWSPDPSELKCSPSIAGS